MEIFSEDSMSSPVEACGTATSRMPLSGPDYCNRAAKAVSVSDPPLLGIVVSGAGFDFPAIEDALQAGRQPV